MHKTLNEKKNYFKLRYEQSENPRKNRNGASRQQTINLDEEAINKWVKNISSKELNAHHKSLLAKGAGFAISNNKIPIEEIIVSTELACKKLPSGEAAALRAEVANILEHSKPAKSNLSKEERTAIRELKEDESITILPADKGKCIEVMDTYEYKQKMKQKLSDENTYKKIGYDPTFIVQEALITELSKIRDNNEIDERLYRKLYPNKTQMPRMFGQPKIHKEGFPLREVVDSYGSPSKEVNSHIAMIIKTLVGHTEHYVKNSEHFKETIKDLVIEENETLVSYDVKALYPSVPQDEAIEIIYKRLKDDANLHKTTLMSAESIVQLFKLCVQNTYFMFDNEIYQQTYGLAIGASTSGFAADIFMEDLEKRALSTFSHHPKLWLHFVRDTFAKLSTLFINPFLEHLNGQHRRIKLR